MAPDIDDSKAPLLEHLIELRQRLVWAVVALLIAFAVSFYFADEIFGLLVVPLTDAFPPGEGKLVYTKLYEAFFVEIKVAMFAAFLLAFPVISNQLWAFVAPGLYANEKRAFLPFLFATPLLFTAGAALAYYIVMPTAFRFFLGFEGEVGGMTQEALPAMGDYLDLVMRFMLAFGVCFQLPVLLLLLNRAGLVTRDQLKGLRRYMVVAAFVLAAILTPPDVVSQFLLGIPLIMLYEVSLAIMWFTERKRKKAENTA
ncbi:MAG: twin-arginine translocase subunit TatC [Parasphingorhabdus sp.]|uniref:twin-arginine translocase subunit TatC n=1 Tax=Parasphingorhabdus sp. TaxID=2709688 RepID=UPI0032992683